MIVLPEDEVSKVSTPPIITDPMIEDVPDVPDVVLDFDPPPAYAAFGSSSVNIHSPTPRSPRTFRNKPINYVYVNRMNRSIKDSFVIDPFKTIPPLLLPPLEAGERESNRKNLKLYARNGSINVDITLLSGTEGLSPDEAKRKSHPTIDIKSDNGCAKARLRVHAQSASDILVPFHFKMYARNGSVTAGLPQDFEGFLRVFTQNGSVDLSNELSERVSTFNENSSVSQYFIGSLPSSNEVVWNGNEVVLEAINGKVKVYLVDEVEPEAHNRTGGLGFFSGWL